jgi:hypothetical protein
MSKVKDNLEGFEAAKKSGEKPEPAISAPVVKAVVKAATETTAIRRTVSARHDSHERELVLTLAAMMTRRSKPLSAAEVKVSIAEGLKEVGEVDGKAFRFEFLQPSHARFLVSVARLMDSHKTDSKNLSQLVTIVKKAEFKINKNENIQKNDRNQALEQLLSKSTLEALDSLPLPPQAPRRGKGAAEEFDPEKWTQAQAFGHARQFALALNQWLDTTDEKRGSAESVASTVAALRDLVERLEAELSVTA